MLQEGIKRVKVNLDNIEVRLELEQLRQLFANYCSLNIPVNALSSEIKEINASYLSRRTNKGAIIIQPTSDASAPKDFLDLPPTELKNLVRGIIWRDQHFKGQTLRQIAVREKFSEGYVGKCIFKTFEL